MLRKAPASSNRGCQHRPRTIVNTDGGATISIDSGKTWTQQLNQPTEQFYHVAADNRFPYYLYGAQQDNSSVAIASWTDEGTSALGLTAN
jgi:hypothetical protein